MKILTMAHGHPSLHKGGGEVAAYSMHTMLQDAGHHSVFVGWGGQPQSPNGGALTQIGTDDYLVYTQSEHFHFSSTSKNLRDALQALLKAYEPDVVHLHHYVHIGIEVAALVKQLSPKTRVVLTLHEYLAICANNGQLFNKANEVCQGYRPERCHKCFPHHSAASFFMREIAIKSAFGFVDHFISPSEFLAEQYQLWGVPAERISVIENPLQIQSLEAVARPATPKKGQRWKIGFFGQINYYKGLDVILEAIRLAGEQGAKVEVGIHGTFSAVNGEAYIDQLKQSIAALGPCATYHGAYRQADVQALMQQYHWVIMGSRWYENSPVVIQEAISAGVPLIVPNHGGMKEKAAAVGVVYQPGSALNLSSTFMRLTKAAYNDANESVEGVRENQAAAVAMNFEKVLSVYCGEESTQ
jgi:glycosyltransferase involved in cell wall biosynthesis